MESATTPQIPCSPEGLQVLLRTVPTVVFSLRGQILWMDRKAADLLGLPPETAPGTTLRKAGCRVVDRHGHPLHSARHPWIRAGKTRSTVADTVTGIRPPGGEIRWQQSTCIPLSDKDSKAQTVLALFTDITQHRQTQMQQMQSQRMEAMGSLAAAVAHDFNNILTGITSATESLLQETEDASTPAPALLRQTLEDIKAQSLCGGELVKQILMFARPTDARAKLVRVDDCIDQLHRFLKRVLPRNIHCKLALNCDDYAVRMQTAQLEQMLVNLVVNARDAMPEGGTLSIRTSVLRYRKDTAVDAVAPPREGTYASIEVADSGKGIREDARARVFDPFYTTKKDGSGMGLAIVFGLVQQKQGSIAVRSSRDEGTVFTILLPARKKTRKKAEPSPPAPVRRGSEMILVVDDEEITTKATARFLNKRGYKTLVAFDGREALEIFKKHGKRIDLVLLDLEMPRMNGNDCLAAMLELDPAVKAIAMSGHFVEPVPGNPVRTGAKAFLPKPYDADLLLEAIRKTLDTDN